MIKWLVDHATTVILGVLVIGVFGTISYLTLPRESSPDISIPVVLISTPYFGVSPQDIESLVTIPIENELAGLQDLKEMTSTSAEGVSMIFVEFEPEADASEVLTNVRDRVSRARSKLPDDAEESSIRDIAFSDIPILIVNIAGDVDEEVLKGLGDDLRDEITRVPGVMEATVSGGLDREIQVRVDPARLAHYGLSLGDITGAIGNENVNIPGGEVRSGVGSFLVRTPGDFSSALDVESVAIKRIGDRPVFVRDVATVVDTFADRTTIARMNGEPSVSVAVKKRPGANIIDIADAVKVMVADQAATWPEGVAYRLLGDESTAIRDMVSQLQNNILTALILVVGVILLFMGARNALFVSMAIPGSMLVSFVVLDTLGFTLNMIVLFSLILALGMLVDNAIVIVENIYRHLENGMPRKEAAVKGASEVAVAVFASTATTVVAFLPLVFWGGIMGEFMSFLPKTLIIVLIASLVVAVMFLPVFLSRLLPKRVATPIPEAEREVGRLMGAYRGTLLFSIRHRYLTAAAMVGMFVFSIAAYAVLGHGLEFFPESDPDRATVGIRAPDGTDLMATDHIARRVEALLAAEENVDVFVTEVGVSGSGDALRGAATSPAEARISVDFLKDRNAAQAGERVRVEPTPDTIARLRRAFREIPGVAISIEKQEMGPPVKKPIRVLVSGENLHEVGDFAQHVRREIAAVPGVTEISDDYRVGRPELRMRVDRGAAKRVGVSTAQIGNTVRTAVAGTTASTLRDGEDEYDIVVQMAPAFREDIQRVLDLRVAGREDRSPDTFPVPLSAVASYSLAGGTGAIHHVDQDLVVTVSGEVLEGFAEDDVQQAVAKLLPTFDQPGIHLELKGSNAEEEESMIFLLKALGIAVCLIVLVLVAQFDSIMIPAIIMGTVVLSMIGVLWGLIITQTPFGVIMTGIGVISLAGVVVNNAIVLLDYVGQLRKEGVPYQDALIQAGMTRFRPVMLTAVTTVLGLVPMAVGVSFDFFRFKVLIGGSSAQFWGPMAIAVIFGLSFATVLTLIFVPTLYSIVEDVYAILGRFTGASDGVKRAAGAVAKVLLVGAVAGSVVPDAHAVTLDEAFAAAEVNNLDLAMVREQTSQAGSLVGQGWSLVSPRVTGNLGLTLNQLEVAFSPTDGLPAEIVANLPPQDPIVIQQKTQWSGNLTVSQPLFSPEALPTLQGAYRLRDAARADEEGTRQRVRVGVATAFYNMAGARDALGLALDGQASAEHQLDLATRQNVAGVQPRRAVIQAELGLSRARRDVASAREQVVRAEEAFTRVTGLARDVTLELPEALPVPSSLDDALHTSQQSRPDVEAARLRERVAILQNTAKWAGWLPSVNANFSVVYNQSSGFTGQPTFWTAGVNGSWTFWDGGLRLAQTRETASKRRAARFAVAQAEAGAEEDVRVAWERYARTSEALDAASGEVALATEGRDLTQAGFAAGSATWLEVEQAELGVRQANLQALRGRIDRDLAALGLQQAMGVL